MEQYLLAHIVYTNHTRLCVRKLISWRISSFKLSLLLLLHHVRRLSGTSFYHLRQMNTVRKSLTEDAATTMVMRSLQVGLTIVTVSSTVRVRSVSSLYRTCSMPQLESYCVSGSLTTSLLTCEIDYIGCPFSRESNIKCVS